MPALLQFSGSVERDPAIQRWLDDQSDEIGSIAREWFAFMRRAGDDVRELMHDGLATVCVEGAPFCYVGAFKNHVNIGFFHGATLPDPAHLLQGTGHYMRHVKLGPRHDVDRSALEALIKAAYQDIHTRLIFLES